MHVIVVGLQKGGVGKTTVAVNLAAAMALHAKDKKVLVADLDPQATATNTLAKQDEGRFRPSETTAVLFDRTDEWNIVRKNRDIIRQADATPLKNLYVAPSSIQLSVAEAGTFQEAGQRLRIWLEASASDFDIVVVDCPPNLGRLTTNALLAADSVLIPCTPEPASVEAIKIFADTLGQVRNVNTKLSLMGILLNGIDERTNVHKHYRDTLISTYGDFVFPIKIHRSTRFPEIHHKGKLITSTDKKERPYLEYRDLAWLVLSKLGFSDYGNA